MKIGFNKKALNEKITDLVNSLVDNNETISNIQNDIIEINNRVPVRFINSLSALGLNQGCTTIDIIKKLETNTILIFEVVYNSGWISSGMPDGFTNGGILEMSRFGSRYIIRFTRQNQNSIGNPDMYIGSVAGANPTEITWKKVTTS